MSRLRNRNALPSVWAPLRLWVALWGLVSLSGCGGCVFEGPKRGEEDITEKKKEEKPREDFTFGEIRAQPNEFAKDRAKINYVKRGHWATASQVVRANNFDVQADIEAVVTTLEGVPYDIEHTRYSLAYSRPAAFPKGQAKPVETLFFIPRASVRTQSVNLRNDLVNVRGGPSPLPQSTSVLPLDEWQYLFLVLSTRPSAYNILEQSQTFTPLTSFAANTVPLRYYQLIRPAIEKSVPLPTNSLTWSTIAVILWDEIDPTLLTAEQQTALVDWLHWGGLLVINGPNSMSKLKNTFLEPYLPADVEAEVNLDVPDFDELNAYWSLRTRRSPREARNLTPAKPLAGLRFTCRDEGQFVPNTGGLVVERRTGRGRVVVTAFPLNSKIVQNWKNFDGFLNGALLRRPARIFAGKDDYNQACRWSTGELSVYLRDARLISGLRYFARDIANYEKMSHPYSDEFIGDDFPSETGETTRLISTALQPGVKGEEAFEGWMAVPRAGVASWNNFSGAAGAAREHLNPASGIPVPDDRFVMRMLFWYLIALVPVNWMVFRLMGRVEWAWVAAPLIAIVGASLVTRLAHIDIGFSRSRTEIDVIELQAGYGRAHVSRFINFYSALSTPFDLVFEDPTALAQPLPESSESNRPFSANSRVALHRDSKMSLSGFRVESNSQSMVRVEQQLDLGGSIELTSASAERPVLKNNSLLVLKNLIVVRRTGAGYQHASVDQLSSGGEAPLSFSAEEKEIDAANLTQGITKFALNPEIRDPDLRLGRFALLALGKLGMQRGDIRLVAWSEGAVPGIEYRPDTAQVTAASFVIAHIQRAPLPAPWRDVNVYADVLPEADAITITPEEIERREKEMNNPEQDSDDERQP